MDHEMLDKILVNPLEMKYKPVPADILTAARAELAALIARVKKLEDMTPLKLAILFHENYERLAFSFGYETRKDTKHFDETTPNGKLMVAVCTEILTALAPKEPKP